MRSGVGVEGFGRLRSSSFGSLYKLSALAARSAEADGSAPLRGVEAEMVRARVSKEEPKVRPFAKDCA